MSEAFLFRDLPREVNEAFSSRFVNVGEEPLARYEGMSDGKEVRKTECEDTVINDPDRGVFLVADGVSTAHGALASRVLAGYVSKAFGEGFEQSIQGIAHRKEASLEQRDAWCVIHTKQLIITTLQQAHDTLRLAATHLPQTEKHKSISTTCSLMKYLELPSGKRVVLSANVGDSRQYRFSNDTLTLLTRDDSYLQMMVNRHELTDEQAERIRHASDEFELESDEEKQAFRHRNIITNSVGIPQKSPFFSVDVSVQTVLPGDTFLLVSDGVHDNLLFEELEDVCRRYLAASPQKLQQVIQQKSDQIARDYFHGHELRGKPDDIAAVVFRVPQTTERFEIPRAVFEQSTKEMRVTYQRLLADFVQHQASLAPTTRQEHERHLFKLEHELLTAELANETLPEDEAEDKRLRLGFLKKWLAKDKGTGTS